MDAAWRYSTFPFFYSMYFVLTSLVVCCIYWTHITTIYVFPVGTVPFFSQEEKGRTVGCGQQGVNTPSSCKETLSEAILLHLQELVV